MGAITIKLTLTEAMVKAAQLRSLDARSYVLQLLSADVAEMRRLKSCTTVLAPFREESPPMETIGNDNHRTTISAPKVQKLLHLLLTKNVSVSDVALRFGISQASVRRILAAYRAAEFHGTQSHGLHDTRGNRTFCSPK